VQTEPNIDRSMKIPAIKRNLGHPKERNGRATDPPSISERGNPASSDSPGNEEGGDHKSPDKIAWKPGPL